MRRFLTVLAGAAFALAIAALTPAASVAGDVVVVPLKPIGAATSTHPFPTGWAILNIPRGDATFLAILPKNTTVPDATGGIAPGEWVFEGWLADLARPHPCPPPPDGEGEAGDPAPADILEGSDEIPSPTEPVHVCGSRRSSETGFRHFPGHINRALAHTYFPVSQGLLKKFGPPLGDWQFYRVSHSINMGLVPFDVAAITIEPPGTGARRRDYDPRPNPVVVLAGKIPLPRMEGENGGGPNPNPSPTPNPNPGPNPGGNGGLGGGQRPPLPVDRN